MRASYQSGLRSSGCLWVTVSVAVLAACEHPEGSRARPVVRDSAGINIVENPAPGSLPVYTVQGPHLVIGEVAAAREYELHDVGGVVRLSDGRIAVVTGGTEIRGFGPSGEFLGLAGGDGDGPGEFRRIRYIGPLVDDSLLVFDSGTGRVSILAPDGRYVRSEPTALEPEGTGIVAGALRDRTLLTRATTPTPLAATPMYRVGMSFTLSRDGASTPLRTYDGPEAALHVDGSGGGVGSIFISLLPFARGVYTAAGPEHFFIGASESYRIDVWDAGGRLVRIIRAAVPITPMSEQIRQAYIDRELALRRRTTQERGRTFDEEAVRRQLGEQSYPPSLPVFQALLATTDGGLWVKDFPLPVEDVSSERWTIFDPGGRAEAVIELPVGFTPMHIDGDSVLGVFTDDLDVPYVHVYTVDE